MAPYGTMPRMRHRAGALATCTIASCVGLGAWGALGELTLATNEPGAGRVWLLPSWGLLAVIVAASIAGFAVLARPPRRAMTLGAAVLSVVPFLPVPLPPALLAWAGPWTAVLWAVAAAGFVATADTAASGSRWRRWLTGPRAPWAAGAMAFLVYTGVSVRVAPVIPGGDEPHYLIITQSLLADGDLRIENNHQRGDYLAYAAGTLKPDFLRRGADRQIYSIHLPGASVLVLPAFAVGGYPLVKLWLALVAACGALVVWRAAHDFAGSASAAWFAWAATALTAPFLVLAFTVYPDGPGGVLVAVCMAALVSLSRQPNRSMRWWGLLGFVPAALPWLHPRFAMIAGALGLVFAGRAWTGADRWRSVATFLAVPLVSALGWFGYYLAIYGTPNPSAAYGHYTQMALSNAGRGLVGLAFDQQFGLVAAAPVYALTAVGLWQMVRVRRRLGLEWAAVVVPYVLVSAMYHMWWGGHSSPARFLGAIMPACALPIALAWQSSRLVSTRTLQMALLAVSLLLAGVLAWVDEGRLIFNTRDGFALWATWASRAADLSRALPSVFRTAPTTALADGLLWTALMTAAWAAVRWVELRGWLSREAAALAMTTALVLAGAGAMTAVWSLEGASSLAPANGQIALLNRAAEHPSSPLLAYGPAGAGASQAGLRSIRVDGAGFAGRPAWASLWIPRLPAGTYRIWLDNRVAGETFDADLVVGRGDVAVETWRFEDTPAEPIWRDITLPWPVRSLALRVSAPSRASVGSVSLEALSVLPAPAPGAPRVTAARRYGATIVMGVGDGVYLEPPGIWTAGQTASQLVLQGSEGATTHQLSIRAGAVPTDVALEAGTWRERLSLDPGAVRDILVPIVADRATVLTVRSTAGFRPSETEAGSTDTRLLGVWIEFR